MLLPELAAFLNARERETRGLSPDRLARLDRVAQFVTSGVPADRPCSLVFICTHNARRSFLSQCLAAACAYRAGLPRVQSFSGGTEATRFNPHAVAALGRAGFRIEQTTRGDNPIYHVRFADDAPALTCFSKRFDMPPNPKSDFAAVMVCSDAEEACPFVPNASVKLSLPFDDPKVFEGTPREMSGYDDRTAQIATEMLEAMNRAR